MFDRIIQRLKINKYSMLRHGTVAVVTMFGVWMFFGVENIMIAFPIALTSTVMGRQNFQVKTFSKTLKITILHLLIVTTAFISAQNLMLGVLINFIAIFLIMYTIVSPYDLTFYKPFLMLYVFTQYSEITLSMLPTRYLAVIFGVMVVVFGSFINRANEKSLFGISIISSLKIIVKQIECILNGEIDETLTKECSEVMRNLAYKIYVTRHKKYLTTNLGKIQFKVYMAIEHLNLYLRRVNVSFIRNEITEVELLEVKLIIDKIIAIDNKECTVDETMVYVKEYSDEYSSKTKYSFEISEILMLLIVSIEELTMLNKKEVNKIYNDWERTDLDKTKVTFKEYLNPNSIRFKFSMRMAISVTIALLFAEILGFYKIIWAIITIMSVMQPYYEETITKTKDRIIGNIAAILFIGILINIINIRGVTITILIISLYLLYAFKEYYKISLFSSIASICIASLTENINILVAYRIIYVIIGVGIIILVNKYVFPYKLKDGVEALTIKITKLNSLLVSSSIKIVEDKKYVNDVRDIVIHSTLLCQKLNLRNMQYRDDAIENFIRLNNNYVVEVGFNMLMRTGIKSSEK